MALPQTPPKFTAVITGSKEYSIEINDANFETQAWKLPRYEGCQTKTQNINKVSIGDITYGNAAIQKYSRNIYVGNGIIGMDDGGEDTTILNFPQFSYVQSNVYYTINDDGTITTNRLEITSDLSQKTGFYRSFYEDFKIKSQCQIILNDSSIKNNLKDKYNIYNNQGKLQKLIRIATPDTHKKEGNIISLIQNSPVDIEGTTDLFNFVYLTGSAPVSAIGTSSFGFFDRLDDNKPGGGVISTGLFGTNLSPHDITLYNKFILDSFSYTGSLPGNKVDDTFIDTHTTEFLTDFFVFHNNERNRLQGEERGERRLFLTFCESGSDTPIRTNRTGSYPDELGPKVTNNLAELSTGEIFFFNTTVNIFGQKLGPTNVDSSFPGQVPITKTPFNFNYSAGYSSSFADLLSNSYISSNITNVIGSNASPPIFERGRVFLSILDNSLPSLLLNLPKGDHLGDGIGSKGFIILPENLHPYIKKNLTYFLAKAGVPLGVDVVPALDNEFKKLK